MEIRLKLISDSDNTYPSDDLVVGIDSEDEISLRISDSKREIGIDLKEFKRLLSFL
jgi:hypothetical protein